MTLKGLDLAASAFVGARTYESATANLIAAQGATVAAGSNLTVTIPLSAALWQDRHYRLAFFVDAAGSGATVFDPDPYGTGVRFPYTAYCGPYGMNIIQAYSGSGDVYPTNANIFVPQVEFGYGICPSGIDVTSGNQAGSLLFGQSFNETRAVDATVNADCATPLEIEAMTLDGLSISAPSATVGARVYDGDTMALQASGATTVGPGSGQSVTVPILATLSRGGHYRIGFFVDAGGAGGSATLYDPSPSGPGGFPYSTNDLTLVINQAYSGAADAFPTAPNFAVPLITLRLGPSPEVNDGVDNQCPGQAGFELVDEISGRSGFRTPGDDFQFSCDPQIGATAYEFVWSSTPTLSSGCTLVGTSAAMASIPNPPSGACFHVLVRSSAPRVGSWGADSSGNQRSVPYVP